MALREYTASTSTVYYLLGDHLGSTSVVANADGSLHSKQLYKPCPLTKNARGCSVRERRAILKAPCPPIISSPGKGTKTRLDCIIKLLLSILAYNYTFPKLSKRWCIPPYLPTYFIIIVKNFFNCVKKYFKTLLVRKVGRVAVFSETLAFYPSAPQPTVLPINTTALCSRS